MIPPRPKRILLFTLLCAASACPLSAQQWDTLAPVPQSFAFPVVAVADGKIHIMGGGSGGATDAHYAYDPASNAWESRAPVPYKAQQPAGAAVNGKIHFFGGGFPTSGQPVKSHHVYDPVSNSWSQAADLTAPRAIHYSVGLDNVLYSLAGQGMANLCQTYDSATNAWTTKNPLPDNSFWYGAHIATGGHIYRFCGGGYTAPVNKSHRYDPGTDTWTALPNFPNANHGLRGAAIGDKIFIAGGYFDFVERNEVWIFDTNTSVYTPGTPLPIGRNYHNMVAIDSCLYVIGGNNAVDATVGTQLIRLCPYQNVSATKENMVQASLSIHYQGGNLNFQMPESVSGAAQLSLFNMEGKQVYAELLAPGQAGILQALYPGDLASGMYAAQLRSASGIFNGKLFVD